MKRGTSVIELIVYGALFALVSIGAIDLIRQSYTVMAKVRLQREINTEGELSMQRMMREVRLASDIIMASSTLYASPGTLKLQTYADDGSGATTTAYFYLSSGVLTLAKATSSIALTSSHSTIDNLVFRLITASTTSKAIKIEMRLIATTSAFSIVNNFYGTAIFRGSYNK